MIGPRGRKRGGARQGFTLVEMLTVILIIGILAALLVPAVGIAITRGKAAAMRTEVEGISQAIEAYNAKYGDYPPDFSDWALVERHYRRIFPNINNQELQLLLSLCTDNGTADPSRFSPTAVDRAEALVWSLGGFSSDPERPFTGTGGPIDFFVNLPTWNFNAQPRPRSFCQYNTERDNALFEFENDRLGLYFDNSAQVSMTNRVMSTDDPGSGSPTGDWFPVYRKDDESAPYVYFDSRTYDLVVSTTERNGWAPADGTVESGGFVRPYISDQISSSTGSWQWVNPKTFQVIAPGVDGIYGNLSHHPGNSLPLYFQYPTGYGIVPDPDASTPNDLLVTEINGYIESGLVTSISDNYQLDNITNFTSGTLEDDVVEQ